MVSFMWHTVMVDDTGSYNWCTCFRVTLTFPRRHLCEPTGPALLHLKMGVWFPISRESILWNVALWTHLHMFKELMTRGRCSLVAGLNHHSILVESGPDAAMSLWWWRNLWWKCKLWHLHHPPKIIRWLSCFQRALNHACLSRICCRYFHLLSYTYRTVKQKSNRDAFKVQPYTFRVQKIHKNATILNTVKCSLTST